jgi:hypothetical protein
MRAQIQRVTGELSREKRLRKQTENRINAMESQMELYASRVERKTLTPELLSIMEKAGVNVGGIQASQSRRLTVDKADQILNSCGVMLDSQTRMYFKNQLEAAGVMDSGFKQPS